MRYYIRAFGCQFNKSDGERIAKVLEKKGYSQSPFLDGADLVVIIACSVRQQAVDKIKNQILKTKMTKKNAKIVLTGCVLGSDKKWFEAMGCEVKNFKGLEKIKSVSGLVPIGFGCDNFCTYCVVPYTRGREKYRNPKEIISEVKHLIKQGVEEITLIAQNVNSYQSGKVDFADLLKAINNLEGNFQIRFLTNHPKDMSDKLIEAVARLNKVKKQIHLPFQAGDNAILKKMNRKYTREQYLKLVAKIRKAIPNVELTTDVIVGFPGETKKQFQETVGVIKRCRFKQVFIGKYSPRAGTAAFKMKDDVPLEEKRKREQILLKIMKDEK